MPDSKISADPSATDFNDADMVPLVQAGANKKFTWSLLRAKLKTAIEAFTGDTGSGGTKGLVPAPASGDAAAGKVLSADGTWKVVSSSAGGTVTPSGSFAQNDVVLANTADGKSIKSGGPLSTLVRALLSGVGGISYNAMTGAFSLASPTPTVLGGVKQAAAQTGQVQTGIDSTGAPTFAAAPAPSFTGGDASNVVNSAPTNTLTLNAIGLASTIGSAGVIPRITIDEKGRVTSIVAQDAAALMDSKDQVSANAAANTARNASVVSNRWSTRVDITVNNASGVTEASSGYAVTGGCYYPSSNAIVFATRCLQFTLGSGQVFNATY